MSHAEALHVRHPAAGATEAITGFVGALRYASRSEEVRHYARRHLFDTIGVRIAGAGGEVATRAEAVLAGVRPAGSVPVPGRARRADLIDAAFLGGTAAHGIELDDGYTKGSVHLGCTSSPQRSRSATARARAAGPDRGGGRGLRDCHGDRPRLSSGAAASRLSSDRRSVGVRRRNDHRQTARTSGRILANALGIAASKLRRPVRLRQRRRRHGSACMPATRARACKPRASPNRVEGPPGVIEARDGSCRRLPMRGQERGRFTLPPEGPFGMTDCYIKPNPCCRHIQPATEALIALLKDEGIATDEVKHVAVETYRIAAEHAATGWEDFASSQLSFRYLMALALKFRAIRFPYFEEGVRRDPSIAALASLMEIAAPAEIDRLYRLRRRA
jgi:2-methylcitrate dehydratase PrpD